MGWETLAIAGFSALSAASKISQGNQQADAYKAQASAAVQQGEEETQNSANNTVISAGKAVNSFLSSGLTLEGGPMAGINQIFNTGNTNIGRIAQNANNQASNYTNAANNAINSARTAALATLASSAAMGASGGSSTFFGSPESVDSFGQAVGNSFNSIGSSLGMTTRSLGPFQPYGV